MTYGVYNSFPHMRGDVPSNSQTARCASSFSPHAWGCSDDGGVGAVARAVFPTCVGMFRNATMNNNKIKSFPHMRGDVPGQQSHGEHRRGFSPHAWGCSVSIYDGKWPCLVFPTCVGMFRLCAVSSTAVIRFPHMRGDVPDCCGCHHRRSLFSPHAWGCSVSGGMCGTPDVVFPTCVGMFRQVASAC